MTEDVELEYDRMPIEEQLAHCEECAHTIALNNAILAMMMPRVGDAAKAGVLTPEQAERFVALVERLKFLRDNPGGLRKGRTK